ncbi:16S rRNA (cytidine(1402)-2'-O)-methyltransferase [Candidatus Cloacimonadaceae bacterium]
MPLYLVPVPIGNLGDITLRALELLKKAELIACEDTRKTAFLLKQYDIKVPKLLSFHKFNESQREEKLISWLKSGKDLIVVSDAGSPAISDPSESLVQEAIKQGILVFALPGASALIPSISVAGFGTQQFQFIGFLPTQAKKRREKISELAGYGFPSVIYEAPHRMRKLLRELFQTMGDRRICLCREISKLYEEQIRGSLSELAESEELTLKGEFVVVLDAAHETNAIPAPDKMSLSRQISELRKAGKGTREIAEALAMQTDMSRKEAYSLVLEQSKKKP